MTPALSKVTLNSGLELFCLDAVEAQFLERDVGQYFRHRGRRGPEDSAPEIELRPGAVVFDVGANIGVFSAEVCRRLRGEGRVYAFEPLPPIFAALAANAAGPIPGRVEVFPFGLGAREATLEFSYFPLMSCLSSTHRGEHNLAAEKTRVAASLLELIKSGQAMPHLRFLPEALLEGLVDGYVKSRLKIERYSVRVRPLSAVLAELAVGRIDLLKIDVEGAEEEVLAGIGEDDWSSIDRIALELDRFRSREAEVTAMLRGRGYEVHARQGDAERAGDYGLVTAVRR